MVKNSKEFFAELDEKTRSRSACTCGTMLGLLIALLVLTIAGSLYLITLIKTKVSQPTATISPISAQEVVGKISDFFKRDQKADKLTGELVINEQELTALIQKAAAVQEPAILKDPRAAITTDAVIIYGTLTKPLTTDVKVTLVPKVSDSQLDFDITSMTAGKLTLPVTLLNLFEGRLKDLLKNSLGELAQVEISQVQLQLGSLVLR